MNSLYWKWDNAIAPERCQEIIDSAGDSFHSATIGGNEDSENNVVNQKTRKTNIHWSNDQNLFNMGSEYGSSANVQAGWNLEFSAMESFQIGQYPEGGHYKWHVDGNGIETINAPGNKLMHGKTRKISMVLWLNDDFEGGEFEFHKCYTKDNVIKPSIGTIVMFPAWVMHRVKPVKRGVRYSAVTWLVGQPVK